MGWIKKGIVFCPDNHFSWMKTHAANPFAVSEGGNIFRVYFTSRDENNRGHIAWLTLRLEDSPEVIELCKKPVLAPGELGLFDDSGVMMGWLLNVGKKEFLYYLGWNLGVTVPWRNTIGLAVREEPNPEFLKYSKAPLLDRSGVDPFSISYPCVLKTKDGFRMWYGSNLGWGKREEEMLHVIKTATSMDGLTWNRSGEIALQLDPGEYALSKPCVVFADNEFKMWYSYRGESYRIGYAESKDGKFWIRKDHEAGISVSPAGWDSEMICYPFVFMHQGKWLMLYNGNGYGKTGFGLAEWVP